MTATSQSTREISLKLRLAFLIVGAATWLAIGYKAFFSWSHVLIFFPFALWGWLLCGFVFLATLFGRRRIIAILFAGITATVSCLPATILFFAYSQAVSESALDDLIKSAANRAISTRHTITTQDAAVLLRNASSDYEVVFGDSMFESYEWQVKMTNGAKLYIFMGRTSPVNWQVSAGCVSGCP